mgnify:CR=1 FL=1
MKITNYTIHLSLGQGDWKQIPEIDTTNRRELDEIGYTGKLYGKPITFQEYLNAEFSHETRFKVELIKGDNGDFIETYLVTKVKL